MDTKDILVHIMHPDPIVVAGLHAILAGRPGFRVTTDAEQPAARCQARVLVADYAAGLELARGGQRGAVLVVTQLQSEWETRAALDAGVNGYLLQSATDEEVARAARAVGQGGNYLAEDVMRKIARSFTRESLTVRERDVLQLLAEGCCNKVIARHLGIGLCTVKTHVKNVMSKLNASQRTQAVAVAAERGLVSPGSLRRQHMVPAV